MAKLPELPPSPMLLQKSVPAKLRPLAFAPLALVLGFVVLALVGLLGADFEWALLAGLIAGPLGAWLAVGPPFTRRDLARAAAKVPKAPPAQRPFLFFPAALVVAALLYFLVGIAITTTALDADLLALLALGAAIPAAVAIAFVLYGFPRLQQLRQVKGPLSYVPPEHRPYLFVPLALLVAAPLYLLAGFALTELLEPDIAVLLGLLVALAGGFAASARLVGVPKPNTEALAGRLQRLSAAPLTARAPAFAAFVLVVGALLAVGLGGTIGALELINADLAFPLFLLAGWLLAVPVAGALFGYPAPPQPLRSYVPRLEAEQRPAALLPLTLGLGLALMLLLGLLLGLVPLADLGDAALAAAIAFPLAFVLALRLLRVPLTQVDPRQLAGAPERARPLVVAAVGLALGTLLFALVGQALTEFLWGFALSYAAGFAAALALVDGPLLQAAGAQRRERKAREREVEARLRAEMGLLPADAAPSAAGQGFLRRRRKGA